jgi:signal transduction histidine kinase
LVIEVEDDGRGFEPSRVKLSGLRGLQDRVEALGGRMDVASSPGYGTQLRAQLPLTGERS